MDTQFILAYIYSYSMGTFKLPDNSSLTKKIMYLLPFHYPHYTLKSVLCL